MGDPKTDGDASLLKDCLEGEALGWERLDAIVRLHRMTIDPERDPIEINVTSASETKKHDEEEILRRRTAGAGYIPQHSFDFKGMSEIAKAFERVKPLEPQFAFKVRVNPCNVLRTAFKRGEIYQVCEDGIVYVVAASCEEAARIVGSSTLSVEQLGPAIS